MMQVLKLFITFFKVGAFSFGGGYAMLPLIYKEIEEFGLTMTEFTDVVAISQMTPGPIAVNAATYMGYKSAGFWGSCVCYLWSSSSIIYFDYDYCVRI